jgi:hypothetical protein
MESNSANAPPTKGSTGVEAAGKTGEWETNAPNLFKAPQAARSGKQRTLPEGDRKEHGDMGNQRVGEGCRYCKERRRSADHRGTAAAARGLGGQQTAQPGSEGCGHRDCSTDSRSGSWRWGEDRRMSAQHNRYLPGRDASKPGQQKWFSQPQKMPATPADSDAEGGVRVLQP